MEEFLKDLWNIRKLLIVILTPILLLPLPLVADGQVRYYTLIHMPIFMLVDTKHFLSFHNSHSDFMVLTLMLLQCEKIPDAHPPRGRGGVTPYIVYGTDVPLE